MADALTLKDEGQESARQRQHGGGVDIKAKVTASAEVRR